MGLVPSRGAQWCRLEPFHQSSRWGSLRGFDNAAGHLGVERSPQPRSVPAPTGTNWDQQGVMALAVPPLARVAGQGLPDGRGLPVALAFASPEEANRHYLDLASGVMIPRVSLNESGACSPRREAPPTHTLEVDP